MVIQLQKLILILVRITSFIFMSPGFSFQGLPNIFKIALSLSFSLVVYFVVPDILIVESMFQFGILVIKEVIFGIALGYISKLVFGIIDMAGQLVDFQAGFSMASVYDPTAGEQVSNFGKMYYWMSMSIFFIFDLHHKVIGSLIESFKSVPLTEIKYDGLLTLNVLNLFSKVFALGFKLAVPMVIVVLITDIVLGIISRSIPQINVLMLGMPMKAMISFILTFITLSWLMNAMAKNLVLLPGYMNNFFRLLE